MEAHHWGRTEIPWAFWRTRNDRRDLGVAERERCESRTIFREEVHHRVGRTHG